MFINFSVIVFRNSKIESYDPGYTSPFYPYMQIAGIIISFILIIYLGWMPVLFTSGIIILGVLWYHFHARSKVKREGAIFHWFALLGKYQYDELENEFMSILKEKGLRQGDPFDETVINSKISIVNTPVYLEKIIDKISDTFETILKEKKEVVRQKFLRNPSDESVISLPGVLVFHAKYKDVIQPSMQIVVSKKPFVVTSTIIDRVISKPTYICYFLINPEDKPKQQLRMLSRLIDIVEQEQFVETIIKMDSHREIKEYMLQNERFITIKLLNNTSQGLMIGRMLKDVQLPKDVLVALIERNNKTFAPNGTTLLQENDILTIMGETKSITKLFNEYIGYKTK